MRSVNARLLILSLVGNGMRAGDEEV